VFDAKTGLQAASRATAKTGETRAKLLLKKKEEKKCSNTRKRCALNALKTHATVFRLNFMHNPPPQTAHFFDASSAAQWFVNV